MAEEHAGGPGLNWQSVLQPFRTVHRQVQGQAGSGGQEGGLGGKR
jgi:hypothetical protein